MGKAPPLMAIGDSAMRDHGPASEANGPVRALCRNDNRSIALMKAAQALSRELP